ncbi:MAG: zf-HC2 domain-containing protein [Ignavibacteriales bacterium]|nr:MAG: zf-HC2 domain-containing protein [Ignavibacteriales bacterium]
MENNVTCKEVMNHICDNLGEELNSPRCIAIKEHLNSCPSCQSYFKNVEVTIDFYKKYNVNLPDEAHNRLIDYLGLKE